MKPTNPIASILILMLSHLLLGGIASADWHQQISGAGNDYFSAIASTSYAKCDNYMYWSSVASSENGNRLLAANDGSYGGHLYTSTDRGVTWMQRGSARRWVSVASSADGMRLVAAAYNDQLYTSVDGGSSWTPRDLCFGEGCYSWDNERAWTSVASSADGMRLVAASGAGKGVGQYLLYTSDDGGMNWIGRSFDSWKSIASSADGMRLIGVTGSKIYTSTDGGVNWVMRTNLGPYSFSAVASSADGTHLVAALRGGQLYTSTDGGITWIPRESSRNWASVASSADGTHLVALEENNGRIYISTNSGESWTARENSRDWISVASSSDASLLLVADRSGELGGLLYTSTDNGLNWTPRDVCLSPTGEEGEGLGEGNVEGEGEGTQEGEGLALSISDIASGNCNGGVQLDVSVSNVTEAQAIDSLGFSILYDTAKVSFEGIERSAAVSNWLLVNANEIQPGRIVVAGSAGGGTPIAMDSSLLRLNFSWACSDEQCSTTLQLANLDSDVFGATTLNGEVSCGFTSEGEGTQEGEGESALYSFSSSVVGNGSVSPASGSVFAPGSSITVSATPALNWVFDHWEGDLSGSTTPATLLMDKDRDVTAVFRPAGPRVITGTVTNSITGNAVEGAYVEISASIKALAFDTTDESGGFEFTVPENTGAVTLTVVIREYLPQILNYPSPPVAPISVSLVPVGVSTPGTPIAYSGPRTVFVEWQANPEYNLKGYYVWRTPTDADGVPTGTSVKVSGLISATEFQDAETSPGQHYRYQVQALSGADRPSTLSASSEAVRAQFLTVFTPDITINNDFENLYLWDLTPQTVEDANWVRVPVSARSAYEISSSGMDIVVDLPNTLLDVTPGADFLVETTGITDGMSVAANIPVTGELRISAFDLAPRTLFGSGVLFDVYLPKRDSTNCAPMTLVQDSFSGVSGRQGVRIYDDGNPPLSVPLDLENGILCTTGGTCIHGDVNSDGVIDELDVRRILALKVGQFVADECSAWAGDINLDKRVDSADAVMLDRWLNGIAINPPANKGLSGEQGFAAKFNEKSNGTPVVWVGELQGAASSLVQVPVYIRNASPLSGYAAKFNFLAGTEGASFQSAQIAPGLSGFELRTVNRTEGVYGSVEIAAASTESIGTDAVTQIVILTFKVGASAGEVKVHLSIAEFDGSDVFGLTPRHGAPGQVEIVVGANGTGGLEAVLLGDFDGFDTDGDGLLDEAEAAVSGLKQEIFDSLDANGDERLQVSELIEATSGTTNVHRADQNGDKQIALGELLRIIQLYNAQGYGCAQNAGASEDGYEVGANATVQNCKPHTLDYEVQDWRISLSELLRLIQLYNLRSYQRCEAGEDGFCPKNI